MPDSAAQRGAVTAADTELFWREASGPNGERAPAALPLYNAVFAHDHARAAKFLERGASPNEVLFPKRWSVLMVAIAYRDKGMAQLLLHHGANIDYVSADPADYTPLGVALNAGLTAALESGEEDPQVDFSMFRFLLDSGANINLEFREGEDIAIFAANLGQMNLVNELLSRGYSRDLPELKKALNIRHVDETAQPEKDRALATIDRLLLTKK